MAAEISGVDDARYRLSIRGGLGLQVFHLGLGNQSVYRHHRSARVLAGKICRESQRVAAPLGDDRLAVRRAFANDAVGVGNQKGAPEAEGSVAQLIFARAGKLTCGFLDRG